MFNYTYQAARRGTGGKPGRPKSPMCSIFGKNPKRSVSCCRCVECDNAYNRQRYAEKVSRNKGKLCSI